MYIFSVLLRKSPKTKGWYWKRLQHAHISQEVCVNSTFHIHTVCTYVRTSPRSFPIQHSVTYHALSHDVTSNVCTSSISTPETVPGYTTNQTASLCSYATITVNLQFNINNITAPALYYMRTELCMKYKAQKYKMEHTNSTNNQCKA